MSQDIKYKLNLFKEKFGNKIDIKNSSYLEKEYMSLSSFDYIKDYIKKKQIDTGVFIFGFENSILLFEKGFFSRNTKSLYPYDQLSKCSFSVKGKIFKTKRLVLKLRHSEHKLDISSESKFDEQVLNDLIFYLNLNEKQISIEKEKKSKETQKINEEKLLVEKSTKDIEDLWTRIQNDISEHRKTTKLIEQEKTRIEDNKGKIRDLKRSILIESTIEKLPSQGIGSIEFYNNLNQKKTLYDNNQFSNIIRFLSHIENTEKNYRKLYLKSHKSYINSPGDSCHNLLLDTLGSLNLCYQLSEVLINEIDRDTVLFSKVYNKLEDQGYFLNDIEKFKIKNLISISNSLLKLNNNINNLSNVLKEGFESIESSLISIDHSVQDVSIETSLVGDSLRDIENRLYDM